MRREIPAWSVVVVIIVVIAIIGAVFLISSRRQRSASPKEIEQKMQLYKSYRMKGMTKSLPSQSNQ